MIYKRLLYYQILYIDNKKRVKMQLSTPSISDKMSLNYEQTALLNNLKVYQEYKSWLKQNGVAVHQSIVYPAYFGQTGCGYVGVGISTSIDGSKCLIMVPEQLIITCNSAKRDKNLHKIMLQNPHAFRLTNGKQSQFSILMLFIIYHLLLKNKSKYQPYLAICLLGVSHIQKLPVDHNFSVGNQSLANWVRETIQRKKVYKTIFTSIFNKYKDILEIDIAQQSSSILNNVINHAYNIITTRSFGWPMKYRSLVPMADALNHSNFYVSHRMVTVQSAIVHKCETSLIQTYNQSNIKNVKQESRLSKIARFVNNHKKLIKEQQQSQSDFTNNINSNSNINKQQKQQQQQQLKHKHWRILWHQYKTKSRNMRQLHFYEDSCDQDNDTNQDEDQQFQQQVWQFKLKDRASVKQQCKMSVLQKQQYLIQYWMMYVDPSFLSYLNSSTKQQANKQQCQQIQEPSSQVSISSRVSSTSTQSDQSEQSQTQNQQNNDSNKQANTANKQDNIRYFIMSSPKHRKLDAGSQLFTFYGRRSNTFLLAGYHFLLPNNKYDSYAFRMHIHNWRLNPIQESCQSIVAQDIVRTCENATYPCNRDKLYTKQIRLKRDKLCVQFINHCRALLLQSQLSHQQQQQHIQQQMKCITIPTQQIVKQQQTLALAINILQYLLSLVIRPLPKSMSLSNSQLCNDDNDGTNMLQKINNMYAHIIVKNIQYVRLCNKYLHNWHNGIIIQQQNPMQECSHIRQYLYSLQRSNISNNNTNKTQVQK